jgi:hypothetical protein
MRVRIRVHGPTGRRTCAKRSDSRARSRRPG